MFVSTLRSCFYLLLAAFLCVLVLPASAQLPPPGYNSHWRTADGSEKLALEFGGGWDLAMGAARQSETRGWNYMMGAGYNFNRHLALLGEYGFNHPSPSCRTQFLFRVAFTSGPSRPTQSSNTSRRIGLGPTSLAVEASIGRATTLMETPARQTMPGESTSVQA
jgi:hypothetical protein